MEKRPSNGYGEQVMYVTRFWVQMPDLTNLKANEGEGGKRRERKRKEGEEKK